MMTRIPFALLAALFLLLASLTLGACHRGTGQKRKQIPLANRLFCRLANLPSIVFLQLAPRFATVLAGPWSSFPAERLCPPM